VDMFFSFSYFVLHGWSLCIGGVVKKEFRLYSARIYCFENHPKPALR
jgi:hypothetical protein